MNIAFAILRVSTAGQVEGYSLDAQRREITRWCESHGYSVRFFVEEGVSAKTDKLERRPQLQTILAAAERHEFDLLVVHMLDRLARNQGVQRLVMETLGKNSIGFVSILEGYDYNTPTGKLIMSVMGSVNEFFSDQLGVHVRKGLQERARQGLANGNVPFGYRRCNEGEGCSPEGHAGGVHIVEAEAVALIEIFRRYASGSLTQAEAATWLNQQGFRTRNKRDSGRGAGPQPFTTWSIRDILGNPFYAGQVRWNRKDTFAGQQDAIIEAGLFRACQAIKREHRARSKTYSPATRFYLLKGLLRCASCGEPYWRSAAAVSSTPTIEGPGEARSAHAGGAASELKR